MHYVAEWRTYRKLSLRRLSERLEFEPGEELLSSTSLNRVEKSEQPLTPELLHALGQAFDCAPEDILTINPLIEPEVIDLMAAIRRLRASRPERIAEAIAHIDVIAKRA